MAEVVAWKLQLNDIKRTMRRTTASDPTGWKRGGSCMQVQAKASIMPSSSHHHHISPTRRTGLSWSSSFAIFVKRRMCVESTCCHDLASSMSLPPTHHMYFYFIFQSRCYSDSPPQKVCASCALISASWFLLIDLERSGGWAIWDRN